MIRTIEIAEPLFESDVQARWNAEDNSETFLCRVLVAGRFSVFEKAYTQPADPGSRTEDDYLDEFLGEFSSKFKKMMEGAAL